MANCKPGRCILTMTCTKREISMSDWKKRYGWRPGFVFLLLGLLIAAACSGSGSNIANPPEAPETGLAITGSVFDRIDGQGVGGVELYLRWGGGDEQVIATTNESGQYHSGVLQIETGSDIELQAVGAGQSFYPQVIKARMDLQGDLWQLDFTQAWPVSMWARVAERIYVEREAGAQIYTAGFDFRPEMGGGTQMADVPFYYSAGGGSKSLLGLTNSKGELYPDPVWLPIGAEAAFWPEMEGYRFSPGECSWENGPPLESIGLLFIAEPVDQPPQSLQVPCERVP